MIVHKYPVSWYADKMRRSEPFTLLMYGDGEFMVASGKHVGAKLANGEIVTQSMVDEMRASFEPGGQGEVFRASDPNILDPEQYMGRDREMMWGIHRKAGEWIVKCPEWHDGTVWDVASREGALGPFIKAARERETVLVANSVLADSGTLDHRAFVEVPEHNAAGVLDDIEAACVPHLSPGRVFVLCMGLGASLLAMRLRRRCPEATFLDLGSVLDVFAGIGEGRGWRREMYANMGKWRECVRKHLEGSI